MFPPVKGATSTGARSYHQPESKRTQGHSLVQGSVALNSLNFKSVAKGDQVYNKVESFVFVERFRLKKDMIPAGYKLEKHLLPRMVSFKTESGFSMTKKLFSLIIGDGLCP